MNRSQINIRLDVELKARVMDYAKRNHTTLSALVERHLRELLIQEKQLEAIAMTEDAEQV